MMDRLVTMIDGRVTMIDWRMTMIDGRVTMDVDRVCPTFYILSININGDVASRYTVRQLKHNLKFITT